MKKSLEWPGAMKWWIWVKKKTLGDHRFWSIFPFTKPVFFRYPVFLTHSPITSPSLEASHGTLQSRFVSLRSSWKLILQCLGLRLQKTYLKKALKGPTIGMFGQNEEPKPCGASYVRAVPHRPACEPGNWRPRGFFKTRTTAYIERLEKVCLDSFGMFFLDFPSCIKNTAPLSYSTPCTNYTR